MSLLKPVVYDAGMQRQVAPGDAVGAGEAIDTSMVTVGAMTILAANILAGIIQRGGAQGGGFVDTTDTSTNLLAGMAQGAGIQNGTSFRFIISNLAATGQTETIAGGTGVTASGILTIATGSWAEFLLTVVNGTAGSIQTAATVNGSAVITGMTQAATNAIAPGMLVTGTGIPAAATILSVQAGVGFTLSANATATNNPVALTFLPTMTLKRVRGTN
jgi:hypothetical protein